MAKSANILWRKCLSVALSLALLISTSVVPSYALANAAASTASSAESAEQQEVIQTPKIEASDSKEDGAEIVLQAQNEIVSEKAAGVAEVPEQENAKFANPAGNTNAANSTTQNAKATLVQDEFTVRFFVNENGAPFKTIKVHKGDYLTKQEAPTSDELHATVKCWLAKDEQGQLESEPFDFEHTLITSDLDLYAVFQTEYVVSFIVEQPDGQGGTTESIVDSVTVVGDGKTISAPANPTVPSGKIFVDWRAQGATSAFDFENEVISSDITLYANYADACSVVYITNGDPVTTKVVAKGSDATKVDPGAATRKVGKTTYTFKHWSLEENGAKFEFDQNTVENDMVLYAVWEDQKVDITVVYWFERANIAEDLDGKPLDPNNYEFFSKKTLTGFANADTYITAADYATADGKSLNGSYVPSDSNMKSYGHYAGADERVYVQDDGSTVLNVYYNRNIYNFKFDLVGIDGTNKNYVSMKAQGRMTFKDKSVSSVTYEPSTNIADMYTIRAKFEQDISKVWPSRRAVDVEVTEVKGVKKGSANWKEEYDSVQFLGWKFDDLLSHRLTLDADVIRLGYLDGASPKSIKATYNPNFCMPTEYCLEVTDVPKDLIDGGELVNEYYKNGTRSSADPFDSDCWSYSDPAKLIVHVYTSQDGVDKYYYYDKKYYKVDKDLSQDIYVTSYTPRPHGAKSITGFAKHDSHEYMIKADQQCIFLYDRNKYDITFNLNGGTFVDEDGKAISKFSGIGTGTSLSKYAYYFNPPAGQEPRKEGYKFLGWFKNVNDAEPFDYVAQGTLPAGGLNLTAKWEHNGYNVNFYLTEACDVLAPVDSQKVGRGDRIMALPDLTKAECYVADLAPKYGEFQGWYYKKDGVEIQWPLSTRVYDDAKLYAKWRSNTYSLGYSSTYTGGADEESYPIVVPTDSNNYTYGTKVRVQPVFSSDSDRPTKLADGREFICWIEKAVDGAAANYYHVNDFVEIVHDTVLEAFYCDSSNTISIAYYPNYGADDDDSTAAIYPSSEYRNIRFNIPTAEQKNFKREGYIFKGWSLNTRDGAEADLIAAGTSYSSPVDCKFYAQWELRKDLSYTVRYVNEATGVILDTKTVTGMTYGTPLSVNKEYRDVSDYTFTRAEFNGSTVMREDSIDLAIGDNVNVITYYYKQRTDRSYTVNYYKGSYDGSGSVAEGNNYVGGLLVGNMSKGTSIIAGEHFSLAWSEDWMTPGFGYEATGIALPSSITIKDKGNVINVVFPKRADLVYTVNYYKDEVAEDNLLGSANHEDMTFEDVVDDFDIDGYKPAFGYESGIADHDRITIGIDPKTGEFSEEITVNVVYKKRTDFSYKVNYLDTEGTALRDAKVVSGRTFMGTYIEQAEAIDGYTVDAASKLITIEDEENAITFEYTANPVPVAPGPAPVLPVIPDDAIPLAPAPVPPSPAPVPPVPAPAPAPAPTPAVAAVLAPAGLSIAAIASTVAPAMVNAVVAAVVPSATALFGNETPLSEGIEEEATPLSSSSEHGCWVHWLMIAGIILTIIYSAVAIGRRMNYINRSRQMTDRSSGDQDFTPTRLSTIANS